MFTNCYNSGLMVCPGYFVTIVGAIKTDFAHTIHFRERVSPIEKLFKRSVPVVIKLWAIVFRMSRGLSVIMRGIKVAANVTICHLYPD